MVHCALPLFLWVSYPERLAPLLWAAQGVTLLLEVTSGSRVGAEGVQRVVQPGLGGAQRDFQGGGDLWQRHVIHEAHQDHLELAGWQDAERPGQVGV